jgi:hypothetical protein
MLFDGANLDFDSDPTCNGRDETALFWAKLFILGALIIYVIPGVIVFAGGKHLLNQVLLRTLAHFADMTTG